MKIFNTLTRRMMLWFVLVGLLPLVLLGYLTLHDNEQSLRDATLVNLSQLADKKALQIRGYMTERIADTRLIARSDVTRDAVVQLSRTYHSVHSGTPEYQNADARYRPYFERYIDDATMFYDVFLINLQGDIVYSQKHENDFATNLLDGPYRDSGLSDAFLESRLTLESVASTFEFYEPSQAMAAFVAIPVIREGRLLGVIAFQLGITQIQQVAADPIGLGSSGETVLARWIDQQRVMIVSPLKGNSESSLQQVELNVLQPVELSKMPNPMRRALSGIRGSGIETDYRNQQVVAAWRYLPDLRFGMVVKMDADEAFAPLHQQRVFSLSALLLVMLFASVAAYFFGRQISLPLEGLVRTADEVANGNLDKRADETAPGELGLFAAAFNRMTANLQSLYRTLEDRVGERTSKLKQSMAELHIKDAAIASSINAIAIAGLDGKNIYVNQAFADLWRLQRREDAIGRLPTEFLDEPEKALAAIEVLQQQGYWRGELRALRHDGSLADLEVSAHIVTDESGKPVCMMASFVDITERNRSQSELRRSQELLNEAQRLGQLGSWELNLISGELRWSDEVYRIFELDPKLFTPTYENFLNVIHPDDRDRVNRAYTQSLANRQAYDIEHRLRMTDGRIKWVREHCSSDFDEAGKPVRSVGAVQDITEQKLNEDQLRVASIAFETHEGIMITDPDDRIIRVNKAFESITGYSADEVIGHTPHMLSSGKHDQAFYDAMWRRITGTGQWEGEIWDKRKNGDIYPKWLTVTTVRDADRVSHHVGVFSDISQRKLAEEEIYSLAYYDTLTKLPNRRLLQDRFGLALAASERNGSYGVVLFLDLDKFKTLNDTLGHGYGDLLLIEVAARIRACVREIDTVARMGGDEFVVLIEELDADAEAASQKAAHIAEKIRSSLTQPYFLEGHEQHSSPSIGVCLYRGRAESVDSLLKHADMAMYQAKASGRNTVCFFDPVMQLAVEGHVALEADLRRAISLQQLHLYYQVQLDNDHRPLGAEALLRWIHPTRGMVSPAQFIPLAEESMLILEIGSWVLESACRQLKLWGQHARTRDLTLAINVSAQQFATPDFVGQVTAMLRKYRVDPARLKLELTESMVLDDVQSAAEIMHALKGLGVGLSMDDFGTGYSSLSYLKLLPLDQLKIDQSFVRDITSDPNDAVLVQTIIDMAKNFRLNVIAEGVETEGQLAFLKQHGCMAYQGYLFSKPVPIEEFEALLGLG